MRVKDGGTTTRRSTLCDRLKETVGWPDHYDGRAIMNEGHLDEEAGLSDKRGDEDLEDERRMVTYAAGTGIGLIQGAKSAVEIVDETSSCAFGILQCCVCQYAIMFTWNSNASEASEASI